MQSGYGREELDKDTQSTVANAQMAFEKLANESPRTEANLRNKIFEVELSLDAMKAQVESFKRELAIEFVKNSSY